MSEDRDDAGSKPNSWGTRALKILDKYGLSILFTVCVFGITLGYKSGNIRVSTLDAELELLKRNYDALKHRAESDEAIIRELKRELLPLQRELAKKAHKLAAKVDGTDPLPEILPRDRFFISSFIETHHGITSEQQMSNVIANYRGLWMTNLPPAFAGRTNSPRNSFFYTQAQHLIGYEYKKLPFLILTEPEGAFEVHHTTNRFVYLHGFVDPETACDLTPVPVDARRIALYPKPFETNTSLVRISFSRLKDFRFSEEGKERGAVNVTVLPRSAFAEYLSPP